MNRLPLWFPQGVVCDFVSANFRTAESCKGGFDGTQTAAAPAAARRTGEGGYGQGRDLARRRRARRVAATRRQDEAGVRHHRMAQLRGSEAAGVGRLDREGTHFLQPRWLDMEKISSLVENAFRIAWDYLEATGELGEPESAARELLDIIEDMIRRGERRRILIANATIDIYKRGRSAR